MCRIARFALALVFAHVVAAAQVSSKSPSPDGRQEVIIKTSQEGNGTTVWLKSDGEKERLLWRSFRPVQCHWHPSSRFLAIDDPVGKFCTAVIVFQVLADGAKLIYQTPYSDSEYAISFQFSEWIEGEDAIEITIFNDDTHQVGYTYIEHLLPARPKPHPNIYRARE